MEEIKAGDIRIGNWFIGYDGKPFKWGIEHFALLTLEKNALTVGELIREPVILTEDIMRKVRRIESDDIKPLEFRVDPPGERQIENNYWSAWIDKSVCERRFHMQPSYGHTWIDNNPVKNNTPEWWFLWYCGDNGWFISILFKEFKYVHQLQNLYKIFNIDLEISLTGNDLKIEV